MQDRIRDAFRKIGTRYGLEPGDCTSAIMGQQGRDLVLSPAAVKLFNISVEAKNVEKLNVVGTFWEHFKKYEGDGRLKVLVHAKNRTPALITLRFDDFMGLYEKTLPSPPTESVQQ